VSLCSECNRQTLPFCNSHRFHVLENKKTAVFPPKPGLCTTKISCPAHEDSNFAYSAFNILSLLSQHLRFPKSPQSCRQKWVGQINNQKGSPRSIFSNRTVTAISQAHLLLLIRNGVTGKRATMLSETLQQQRSNLRASLTFSTNVTLPLQNPPLSPQQQFHLRWNIFLTLYVSPLNASSMSLPHVYTNCLPNHALST
jgi:hypothetical protein